MNINLCGMRRSGNHAITEWIIASLDGNIKYFNNCQDHTGVAPAQTRKYRNTGIGNHIIVTLAEYDPLLFDIFNHDEILTFETKEECVNIIKEWLDQDWFLDYMASSAFHNVILNHTVSTRFSQIIDMAWDYYIGYPVANKYKLGII